MTTPHDAARRRADNLGRLLADERGAEVLAELQKLKLETASPSKRPSNRAATTSDVVGAWQAIPTPHGPELRRRTLDADELRTWADVDHVTGAGEDIRVVLLGESSARGFLLDPLLTPALALQRQFDVAGGGVQVVDLAHTGADVPDLIAVTRQLPLVEPDVIVVYAGNNWVRSRHSPAHLDLLATALREGGYPTMRGAYLDRIVAPGVQRVLDCLAEAAEVCRAEVVVVVPEFNLGSWTHDQELELPPLAPGDLLAWSCYRAAAETALEAGDIPATLASTAQMRHLDEGMSPVTGRLRGLAAVEAGDPALARESWEESRDAVCGLLTTHTPRVTTAVRAALLAGVAHRGFRCLDLADLLRMDPESPYPDSEFFLDYCHLSSSGIERLATALVAVLSDATPRTAQLPASGLSVADQAIGDILAAVHNSYYGQPRALVDDLVGRATRAHPTGRAFAESLLRLLNGVGPVWSCTSTPDLMRPPHAARYLAPMLSRSAEQLGMWDLRAALSAAVGAAPAPDTPNPKVLDLLLTAEQGLIEGAFRAVNHQPERAFFQSFGRTSRLGFHLHRGCGARVSLTYRVPAFIQDDAMVSMSVNGCPVAQVPPKRSWTSTRLEIPRSLLREGINSLEFQWPCGGSEWSARQSSDARALACGEYPLVLGVQGELFELLLEPDQ